MVPPRRDSSAAKAARAPSDLSPVKRAQILEGARDVFREQGYERASVDAIASRAGVSKATIYNHFHDKHALFLASLGAETDDLRQRFHLLMEEPSGDVGRDLRRIGAELLRLVSNPSHVQRYRVVVGVVEQFPELGRTLFECGMQTGREKLARFLGRAAAAGQLVISDPTQAAIDFHVLCAGELTRQLHLGVRASLDEKLIAKNVDHAVKVFLAVYGRPAADSERAPDSALETKRSASRRRTSSSRRNA